MPEPADLTYRTDELFVTFLPETPAGEDAWRTLATSSEGTGRFFLAQRASVIAQLRDAGYVVKPATLPEAVDTDALLAELGVGWHDISRQEIS